MDLDQLERVKRLVVIALFSDDDLIDKLVFKGGNAVDLIYGAAMRGSVDLDFSLDSDLPGADVATWRSRFDALLNTTFNPEGFRIFDVTFERRPPIVSRDLADFWGGYRLEFKVIRSENYDAAHEDQRRLRTTAESVAGGNRKKLRVDISCHEYCRSKDAFEIDGYTVFVYTPAMIVCEKLRAICQQMPEYGRLVRSHSQSARAKDFFDIHVLIRHFGIDLSLPSNVETLRCMFMAKRVPLHLLGAVRDQQDFHQRGFATVKDTVKPGVKLRSFEYYFAFVVAQIKKLEPFWNE